jgi:hypothetical protein
VDDEAQTELKATIEARKELGPEHEEHLIAGFLDRIEKEIDRRVDQRVDQRVGHRRRGNLPLAAQIGPMVPIVIFAGIFGGSTAVIVALLVVAAIVVFSELRR